MKDKINWRSVPLQYSFCARDECGSVRLFQLQPMQTRFGWVRQIDDNEHEPLDVYGNAFGYQAGSYDWTESLIERE